MAKIAQRPTLYWNPYVMLENGEANVEIFTSDLGYGFQEVIYQRALAYEFRKAGLESARKIEQNIFYKDLVEPIGTRRADFVVEGKVLLS